MNGMIRRSQIAGMNLVYKYYPFRYFLDSMQELGFTTISVWGGPPHFDCDHLSYQDCKRIVSDAASRNLTIGGFLVTGSNYRYQIAEDGQSERMFQYFKNGILAWEELGSPVCSVSSGWGYFDRDREESFRRSRDMLYRLSEEAQRHHVCLVMESLKSLETNLCTTIDDTERMYHEVNHPSFQIMADTGAIAYAHERLEDWFQRFGKAIRSMHFVDGMHQEWGDGMSALDDMMLSIARHNYTGILALETSAGKYMRDPKAADQKAMRILERFIMDE